MGFRRSSLPAVAGCLSAVIETMPSIDSVAAAKRALAEDKRLALAVLAAVTASQLDNPTAALGSE